MTFGEITEKLNKANKTGEEITAYAVVFPECMKPEFRELVNRTYLFTSREKAFQANACSNSIWADCLDGEKGVKLSEYLAGPDAWTLEECGFVSFVLTSTYERESTISVFSTLAAAQAAMRAEMADALGVAVKNLPERLADCEGELNPMSAWANDCGIADGNADWNIFPVFYDGMQTKNLNDFI